MLANTHRPLVQGRQAVATAKKNNRGWHGNASVSSTPATPRPTSTFTKGRGAKERNEKVCPAPVLRILQQETPL